MDIRTGFSQKQKEVIIIKNNEFIKCKRELASGEIMWPSSIETCKAFLQRIGINISLSNIKKRYFGGSICEHIAM